LSRQSLSADEKLAKGGVILENNHEALVRTIAWHWFLPSLLLHRQHSLLVIIVLAVVARSAVVVSAWQIKLPLCDRRGVCRAFLDAVHQRGYLCGVLESARWCTTFLASGVKRHFGSGGVPGGRALLLSGAPGVPGQSISSYFSSIDVVLDIYLLLWAMEATFRHTLDHLSRVWRELTHGYAPGPRKLGTLVLGLTA